MTRLYKNFRIHQVFGASTDVGKTILTTALCRVSASRQKRVYYLKPVSTGAPLDADDGHIKQFSGPFRARVHTHCIFRYNDPVSPHLAAQLIQEETVSDGKLVNYVADHVDSWVRQATEPAVMYLETSGGVHSPVMSGTTQVDAYRPLLLPTILVGDPRLGGISSTISAYESLLLRGYRIDAVAMFRDSYYRNHEYLLQYFAEQGIPFFTVTHPPDKLGDAEYNHKKTQEYYSEITDEAPGREIMLLEDQLDHAHEERLEVLATMSSRAMDTVWWPFVQHGLVKEHTDVTIIDSACGDFFSVFRPSTTADQPSLSLLSPKFDGSASWWTQALGHGNASLTLAAAKAAGRYGHVIFPQASHLPALRLAEYLVYNGPGSGWASRAYFSDDGSTGMEIALKMAFRAFSKREGWRKHTDPELSVLGLKGSYHGDTIGAMDACEEGIFTCEWHNAKGHWLDPPTVGIRAGRVSVNLPQSMLSRNRQPSDHFESLPALYDVKTRLQSPVAEEYRNFIVDCLAQIQGSGQTRLAALVIEPLVMGAGGMVFVDPLFQRVLVDTVRSNHQQVRSSSGLQTSEWRGIPVIFDEVFSGLYRLGLCTCSSLLGVNPDIAVYAKILTGGLVPMAVTLANESIYRAFLGETKAEALLHGHSYTAHPVGCEVANEALALLEKLSSSNQWTLARHKWQQPEDSTEPSSSVWSLWDPAFISELSMNSRIEETMTLGSVLAIKLRESAGGYGSMSAQATFSFLQEATIFDGISSVPFGVHFRTLGNVAYLMCSLNTRSETLRALERTILDGLKADTRLIRD